MSARNALDTPPLESGDRLIRQEFEHRYAAFNLHKAELIEGVVYVASPARAKGLKLLEKRSRPVYYIKLSLECRTYIAFLKPMKYT